MIVAQLLAGYTNSEVATSLTTGAVCAGFGYWMSNHLRGSRGVTPWRLPSGLWAAICFFLQPFGVILELVAQATTKPTIASGQAAGAPPSFPSYEPAQQLPTARTYPGVADDPQAVAPVDVEIATGPAAPAGDGTGQTPLFGWYPDVTGRHEERYWDGRRWSEFVRDHGVAATDPL